MSRADPAGVGDSPERARARLLLFAALVGAIFPWAMLALVIAGADHLPPPCFGSGGSLPKRTGQVLYSVAGTSLWWANADLGSPQKLVDYSQAMSSPSRSLAFAEPASQSPAASSAGTSPLSTPLSRPAAAEMLAAALSPDRGSALFLVLDPPDAPGMVSLRHVGIAATPTPPVDVWSDRGFPSKDQHGEIKWISADKALFRVPHQFAGANTMSRLVGVVALAGKPALVENAPEADFIATTHSMWPETRDLKLPPLEPRLEGRVVGQDVAAGTISRVVTSMLSHRVLHQLSVGQLGQAQSRVICATTREAQPLLFSPDGKQLLVEQGEISFLLDLKGGPPLASLLEGRFLDWQAAPASP